MISYTCTNQTRKESAGPKSKNLDHGIYDSVVDDQASCIISVRLREVIGTNVLFIARASAKASESG